MKLKGVVESVKARPLVSFRILTHSRLSCAPAVAFFIIALATYQAGASGPASSKKEPHPLEIEQVFIPGGDVMLGSDEAEKAYAYSIGGEGARKGRWFDGEVRRRVRVEDFYIDKYPITQAQYSEFVKRTDHRAPYISKDDYIEQGFLVHPYRSVRPYLWKKGIGERPVPPEGKHHHPGVLVSLTDAAAYCAWRRSFLPDRKFRLPYEDEWEKAARGTDGRYFPWGDGWDDELANIWRSGPHGTTPVTRYKNGRSPYGVYEMAGNIFEWTLTPSRKRGEGSGRFILKSCSWDDMPGICRAAARHARPEESRHILIGFRCVSVPKVK
jgi:formylglycine-generating enzyme required for sulfatase activity